MADIPYSKINWQNEPNHTTPLSAENLNKMDTAIYDLVAKSNSLVPNPAESPTEGLEKLEYDGTVYEVKGGHKILNDSGSVLTQMDNMQFNGVYTHNASTITEVDIVREFSTVAEIEALTGEAQKGIQYVEGDADYIPFDAKDIQFDNTGTSFTSDDVDGVLREIDGKFNNTLITQTETLSYTVSANSWGDSEKTIPSVSGYSPIGIVGIEVTNTTMAVPVKHFLDLPNNKIKVGVINRSNASITFDFKVYILYSKI